MSLANLLAAAARVHGDRTAVALGAAPLWSFTQFGRLVASTAGGLRDRHGLAPGDRVGLLMSNSAAMLQSMFACWHAGLCAVPINPRLHPAEVAYILSNSGARLCLVSPDLRGVAQAALPEASNVEAVLASDDADFARLAAGEPIAIAERAIHDPAWLFYTSGTTGRPKGAVLSHRNLLFMSLVYLTDIDRLTPDSGILHGAPMSHGSGLYALPHMAAAACQIVPESGHFEPDEVVELINHHGGVSMFAAPTMLVRLIDHPALDKLQRARLKTIVSGGGPLYVADLERALERLGPRVAQIYGQGESPMTITTASKAMISDSAHPRHAGRLASVGIAFTGVEVRIHREDGSEAPAGEAGEVVTRSDCMMSGYWNNEAATAQTMRGGWLHTGDVGSMDSDGLLTLKDRSKDLVISGGSNIYPREVEEILLRHPAVSEVAVVGRPHAEWGEEVVAFVVARDLPPPAIDELDALCLAAIARFKRPKAYRLVSELPKNNYGKVLKTALRERLAKEPDGDLIPSR